MTSKKNSKKPSPHVFYKNMADDAIALQILDFVEKDENISQRKIIEKTGLATGLVHSYMRKVINKGLVKAKQVSAKRWLYYLTPEGFLEKSRLTIKYLSITLSNYRETNGMVRKKLQECKDNGWVKLIVAGDNELAEITAINIKAFDGLNLAGVVADKVNEDIMSGFDISPFDSIDKMDFDKILICDVSIIKWLQDRGRDEKSFQMMHI